MNTGAVFSVNFPSGLVIKAGHVLSMSIASQSFDGVASAMVNGYYVASTLCTVTWSKSAPAGCV